MTFASNRQLIRILSVIIFLVLLRPHFDFGLPVVGVYFADGMILALIFLILIKYKMKMPRAIAQPMLTGLMYISLLIFPLLIHSFKGSASFDILFIYLKLFYYLVLFGLLTTMSLQLMNPYEFYSKMLNISFIIIFFVALLQFLNPPILGNLIKVIYGSAKLRDLYSKYPRVFSTFYNANWFGVYLVFFLGWINSNFLFKKISLKMFLFHAWLVSLLFFLSGSRTALLGGSIVMFIQWFDHRYIRRATKFLPIIVVGICSIFFGFKNNPFLDKTLNRFTSTWNLFLQWGFDMSVLDPGRWYTWSIVFERFKSNPLIGSGKSVDLIPHNSYLYFLDTFGLMGVSLSLLCAVALLFIHSKEKKKTVESNISCKWLYSFIVSFGVMCLFADFIFTTQVMLLLVISASVNLTFKYSRATGDLMNTAQQLK
jgi:hypothetical protein